MIVAVAIAILAIATGPEKISGLQWHSNLGLCVTLVVLYQLSYEDPTLGPAGVNLPKLLQV